CASGEPGKWSLSLKPINQRQKENLGKYSIHPADRYDFKGKLVGERSLKYGLGAPVVAVAKGIDYSKVGAPPADGKLRFYGLTAVIHFQGRKCELQLIDPLAKEKVTLDGRQYPLAADFQAPIALALSKINLKKIEVSGMFSPSKHEDSARLALLQPYDPNKIPVLFIHGLGNSAGTWAPMINHLRNNATIRKRYQFWIFNYPTGLPYPENASTLKRQMDEVRQLYPGHKDIVIVAHSLGGNISRLLITDSGMKLWNMFYDKPPADIPFSDDTRKMMSGMLIFKARPDISRVIFASASLGGSATATGFIGKMGIKLIGNPFADDLINEEAFSFARPEI
ncbi:MAG: alpha/beta hydrolase, partial [Deltaproteobacteria bacterium]